MTTDQTPETILYSSLMSDLIADADGHQHDVINSLRSGMPGALREHFEITPAGVLVSAHRTAL